MYFNAFVFPLSLAALVSASTLGRRAAFTQQNGQDAQALNAQFQELSTNSPCTDGDNACVNGGFAQCIGGTFSVTQCASGLQCFALPLVNSPGTSITCDTEADATNRIAATGAAGGLFGKRNVPVLARRAAFTTQNGIDAQGLNLKFQSLSTSSSCTSGENACINGEFAQCANGQFVTFPCSGGLKCFALPLVNSPGTSITCDTEADATARITNTGVTGGLLGKREPAPQKRATSPPACAAKGKKRNTTPALSIAKRIAQTDLGAVAQSWQDLCLKSGGDIQTNQPCVQLAGIAGINSLLANGDSCAQQDNADAMHPRNALNINGVTPSTLFCQKAPKNAELKGLVNAQLDGVDPGLFGAPNTGIVAFGAEGTCPFGKNADVSTCTCN
ncbi:hypothetical protein EW146_g6402 [Bondarzewia mesenterica]|uniref:Carbohydrate-binding module family 19 domain-containing protein n=1 Tax=Bondarzewia mesenterica TaxID=1095465 RepID=A0A4S4LNR0_9AGAM|nr:hypothetical protein EW146_g6402 [Bondarzewia mesenterica]